jgi:uncharacterized membrane protein
MLRSLDTLLSTLPMADWAAAGLFLFGWIGYALFAKWRAKSEHTLLASTNHFRRLWMHQVTYRDQRIVDAAVVQNLSSSPSFWASTTILVLGGLLAVLGTSEKASDLVKDLPFAARTSMLIFDLKILALLAVFVYAFFRFTWSMRVYSFGAILVGAAPNVEHFDSGGAPTTWPLPSLAGSSRLPPLPLALWRFCGCCISENSAQTSCPSSAAELPAPFQSAP